MTSVQRPRILLVATRSADRHLGGSAMRAAATRRGLERLGDVTFVLVDEQPPDRPGAIIDPGVRLLRRRRRGVPHRWPVARALVGGRRDAWAVGVWELQGPDLDVGGFDLAWFVKAGAALSWSAGLPRAVVLDFDDLEEDTRRSAPPWRRLDAWATRGLRRRLTGRADLVVAAAVTDLPRLPAGPPRRLVPNGVPALIDTGAVPDAPHLLFVGLLGYAPNRDGLVWFVRTVLPILRTMQPGVRVRVVGPGAHTLPADVRRAVDITGPVADLVEHYRWARAVIAPVRHGSGTRVKVLDAFAHGRCVVATPAAVRGLGLAAGDGIAVAGSTEEFAATCAAVLRPGGAQALTRAARAQAGGRLGATAVEERVAEVAALALGPGHRIWLDTSEIRTWPGRPHGIARVEAGLARELGRLPQGRATWQVLGRTSFADGAALVRAGTGSGSGGPPVMATSLGRYRRLVTTAAQRGPAGTGRLLIAATGSATAVLHDVRGRQWRARATAAWRRTARPDDVVLLAGLDWNVGVLDAILGLPADRRPRIWGYVTDLVPLTHPDLLAEPAASARFARWLTRLFANAEGVAVMSRTTAAEVERAVHGGLVPHPPRLVVVPPGLDIAATSRRPPDAVDAPYVVFVSTIERRKNHRLLVEVARTARESGRELPTIVWVGAWGWDAQRLAGQLADAAELGIVHLEGLADDEVRWVMENAIAVVSPAWIEGLGLPIAEAHALGIPVIASDIPAHREAAGGHGRFLPADDVAAWVDALAAARTAPPPRVRPRAGRTWAQACAQLLDAIDRAGSRRWTARGSADVDADPQPAQRQQGQADRDDRG